MGSNKLLELGTRSYTFSCFISALLHPIANSSLFVYSCDTTLISFLVYVDDMIIIGSDLSLVDTIIQQLDSTFSTKDLRPLSYLC